MSVTRSAGMPRETISSRAPDDGTITWSAARNSRGHSARFTLCFHAGPVMGRSVVASVPNKKAVPLTRAARYAIQKLALGYPVQHRMASNSPLRISFHNPVLQYSKNPSPPRPRFGTSVQR